MWIFWKSKVIFLGHQISGHYSPLLTKAAAISELSSSFFFLLLGCGQTLKSYKMKSILFYATKLLHIILGRELCLSVGIGIILQQNIDGYWQLISSRKLLVIGEKEIFMLHTINHLLGFSGPCQINALSPLERLGIMTTLFSLSRTYMFYCRCGQYSYGHNVTQY